jgi:hypothetical protein
MKTVLPVIVFVFLLFAQAGSAQNPRNILIDDLTSTNCGHCPCMDTVLQKVILKSHPNTIIIAIHSTMSAYENNDFRPLVDSLHFESDGAAGVNRMGIPSVIDVIVDTVNARYARMPQSPVKMEIVSRNYDPGSRKLQVVVKSTALEPNMNGIYRINAAIVESNLIGYQQHFPECPGGDSYNHRFVLRALNFIPVGDIIVNGNWAQQTSFTRTFIMDVDEDWVESNCDVLLYIDKMQGPLNYSEIQQAIKQGVTRPMGVEPVTPANSAFLGVFPNPVKGTAKIHLSIVQAGKAKIELIDMNGKNVKTLTDQKLDSGLYNLEFDASAIPSGNYLIRMDLNHQVYSTKIQIQ